MKNLHKVAAVTMVAGSIALVGAGAASAHTGGGAHANGVAKGSPGVVSGNTIQVPVHIPVNVCGNTISVIGVLNPAIGNFCLNK
ncbi:MULTISPECIES: chaplin [unclassified Streptomyces]|uniref:chaplin n=1 Tax=unclassified Streptomyces TaxID=2593676 RepID=UPI00382996E8